MATGRPSTGGLTLPEYIADKANQSTPTNTSTIETLLREISYKLDHLNVSSSSSSNQMLGYCQFDGLGGVINNFSQSGSFFAGVNYISAGTYQVRFAVAQPDLNYIAHIAMYTDGDQYCNWNYSAKTLESFTIQVWWKNDHGSDNMDRVEVSVFRYTP